MAVTQQLARISSPRAACARGNAAALASIISFEVIGNDAFADFDWSPQLLHASLQVIDETQLAALVESAFEGAELLNADCPDAVAGYRVYADIRMHPPDAVHKLAAELPRLPIASMMTTYAALRVAHPGRELPNGFPDYVQRYASMLVEFYAAASRSDQAVITWWD